MMISLILSSVNAVFLAVTFYLLRIQHKKFAELKEQYNELKHSVEQINKEHPTLVHADLLFSKKLNELQAQLVSMDNQVQALENKRTNDGGYQHAMKILEMGGNRDEIVKSCHLSPAEADFLENLQAYRAAMDVM